jgi:NAD-dependent dihydropyrimidine dehydrogenase PreA subunit
MDTVGTERNLPRSCKSEPDGRIPVVDRNRCEGKRDCEVVCPYGVFEVRVLTAAERAGVSLRGRLNLLAHRGRQAVVVAGDQCHQCGLCVAACPERAIRLALPSLPSLPS